MPDPVSDYVLIPEYSDIKGSNKWILKINCQKCKFRELKETIIILNSNCRICLVVFLQKFQKDEIVAIINERDEKILESVQISWFIEYIHNFKFVNTKLKSIKKELHKKCKYFKTDNCRYSNFLNFLNLDLRNVDPISFFSELKKTYELIQNNKIKISICQNCFSSLIKYLNTILQKFKSFSLIKNLISEKVNDHRGEFLDTSKDNNKLIKKSRRKSRNFQFLLLKKYFIGPNDLYQVSIYKKEFQAEMIYEVEENYEYAEKVEYYKEIAGKVCSYLKSLEMNKLYSFQDLFNFLKTHASVYLKRNVPYISDKTHIKLSYFSVIKILNVKKLFPFLIDDYIEEIFLDQPKDNIYLNHQTFGRCRTKIRLYSEDINRIKTFLRVYSKERLDIIHPSIKTVIKNEIFHCRFSVDVDPLQLNEFCLDIRKLNKNVLTLLDLLRFQSISPEICAFLYFCVLKRINITVTGETDTGKTTLINALDLITPKEFRKIYVENAVESLDELSYEKHQVKYKSQSLENLEDAPFKKSNLIQTLLHRSPDIIFLGEILTEEECKAMFHCMSAGLRGFQTIHSRDILSLINRFLYHFKIDETCFNDLDLIILMKKLVNGRKVVSISEINNTNGIMVENIFEYVPRTNNWIKKKELFQTKTISRILKYEDFTKEDFNFLIETFIEIFNLFCKDQNLNLKEMASMFHIVGFLSLNKRYEELIDFLEGFKK